VDISRGTEKQSYKVSSLTPSDENPKREKVYVISSTSQPVGAELYMMNRIFHHVRKDSEFKDIRFVLRLPSYTASSWFLVPKDNTNMMKRGLSPRTWKYQADCAHELHHDTKTHNIKEFLTFVDSQQLTFGIGISTTWIDRTQYQNTLV
jgi:hypothetical protein